MRLLKIKAINYKMHKEFSVEFDPSKNYVVSGSNKVGKTTIANMILWNLTGKDIEGRSNFDVRNHNVAPDNEVILSCLYSYTDKVIGDFDEVIEKERTVTLTRKLVGKFSGTGTNKKYNGDLTAYEIDGSPCTAEQYDERVYRLFNTNYETIKSLFNIKEGKTKYDISILLNIREFMYKLSNKEQRHILTSLFSKITPLDVVEAFGDKYNDIKHYIVDNVDLLEVQRKINGQIAELVDEVGKNENEGKIQTRIKERKKDIVEENFNIEDYIAEIERLDKEIQEKQQSIIKIKNDTQVDSLNNEINALRNDLGALKNENDAFKAKEMQQKTIKNIDKINSLKNSIAELERENSNTQSQLNNIEKQLGAEKFKLKNAEEELAKILERKWDSKNELCPTCNQLLPGDKIRSLKENFEAERNKSVARFTEIITKCKECISDLEEKQQRLNNADSSITNNKAKIKAFLNEITELKLENAKVVVADMPNYQSKYDEITEKGRELKKQIEKIQENKKEEISKIEDLLNSRKKELDEIQKNINIHNRNQEAEKRISELYHELETKTNTLSEAQYISLLIDDFIADKDNMSQTEINNNFQYVEWQMYGKLKGSDKLGEKCVCMIKNDNNNTFESTNKASKINATVDIANAFAKALGCSFVLVIDDFEGVDIDNFNIQTENQLIKLKVISKQPILMIETEEEHKQRMNAEMELIKIKREKDLFNYELNERLNK